MPSKEMHPSSILFDVGTGSVAIPFRQAGDEQLAKAS
jgi:hypothetical protein